MAVRKALRVTGSNAFPDSFGMTTTPSLKNHTVREAAQALRRTPKADGRGDDDDDGGIVVGPLRPLPPGARNEQKITLNPS